VATRIFRLRTLTAAVTRGPSCSTTRGVNALVTSARSRVSSLPLCVLDRTASANAWPAMESEATVASGGVLDMGPGVWPARRPVELPDSMLGGDNALGCDFDVAFEAQFRRHVHPTRFADHVVVLGLPVERGLFLDHRLPPFLENRCIRGAVMRA
jgi:hypothetical protein